MQLVNIVGTEHVRATERARASAREREREREREKKKKKKRKRKKKGNQRQMVQSSVDWPAAPPARPHGSNTGAVPGARHGL